MHNLDEAKKLRDELIAKNYPKNKFTHKILRTFIIPYFKKLTTHLENKNIPSTNNKIENIFQKIFLKHIKRTRISSRLMLKLNYWNIENEKEKITQDFEKANRRVN